MTDIVLYDFDAPDGSDASYEILAGTHETIRNVIYQLNEYEDDYEGGVGANVSVKCYLATPSKLRSVSLDSLQVNGTIMHGYISFYDDSDVKVGSTHFYKYDSMLEKTITDVPDEEVAYFIVSLSTTALNVPKIGGD